MMKIHGFVMQGGKVVNVILYSLRIVANSQRLQESQFFIWARKADELFKLKEDALKELHWAQDVN